MYHVYFSIDFFWNKILTNFFLNLNNLNNKIFNDFKYFFKFQNIKIHKIVKIQDKIVKIKLLK